MTQTASGPFRFDFSGALRRGLALLASLVIGMMLVLTAGVVAVMTAIAGLLLAAAALVMRFVGQRPAPMGSAPDAAETITLEARRTPRGWTVE